MTQPPAPVPAPVAHRGWGGGRGRLAAAGLTLVVAIVALFELGVIVEHARLANWAPLGVDLHLYLERTRSWLDDGTFYLPRQLAGPYRIQGAELSGDVLYPPIAILLFAPFLVLPQLLWWLIPLGVIGVVVARLRPAAWTWPVMAALVAIPRSLELVWYGQPTMWVAAAAAAGLLWGWPSVFVVLKPSLLPFALVGIRTRAWWIAAALVAAVGCAFGTMWLDYARVIANSNGSPLYSLADLPFVLVPFVAWLGRGRR